MGHRDRTWSHQRWDDPQWVATLRAEIESELLEEHGPDWYQQHLATADANWEAALFQLGALG